VIRVLALCLFWCTAVSAQSLSDMSAAYEAWVAENKIKNARLAVMQNGKLLSTTDNTPVELASLSKAITAVCVMHLVEEGALSYDSTVRDVLGGEGPVDLTVAQLLTHSGGVFPDHTQGWWSLTRVNAKTPAHAELSTILLNRPLVTDAVGKYRYANDNYALLAQIIDVATVSDYEKTCAELILSNAGVTPMASKPMYAFLAWGGWSMSVADYAKFHDHYFSPKGAIGRDPFAYPHVDMGGGAYYGMGMTFRKFGASHNHWHFGAHCFPAQLNTGSFAVLWENGWSAVAAYDGCLDWDQMVALDQALSRAVYPQ